MPDNSQDLLQGAFTKSPIEYPIEPKESVGQRADPLALDIPDEELAKISDQRIKADIKFYMEKYHLYDRRRKNEVYYFGRQVAERERKGELKEYESRAQDNVLYEIMASLKPLAMSHLPDLIVTPGQYKQQNEDTVKQLSKVVDAEVKKRQMRFVLGLAFKHQPVYFIGVIKGRWNPTLGKGGDYVFEVIHPDNIVFDHNCTTNNADEMAYVAQAVPLTVQELVMRFPAKKEDIFTKLHEKGVMAGTTPTYKEMATQIKIWEIWADWYKRADTGAISDQEPQADQAYKWEKVSGVIWKYDTIILKKMKNPNYDFTGDSRLFTYDVPGQEDTKREVGPQDVVTTLLTGQAPPGLTREQVYHNYFDMPRKPFFFLGYDQWGKQPLDETSWLEQNLHNQEVLDRRNKQIDEELNNRGKHVFSKDGGLKPDDIERMDMNDPMQDILIDGDVNKAHAYVPPIRPDAAEFNDLAQARDRMYGVAGASAIRGQIQSQVATTNQIAREADFTRADDLVEDTINAAAEWIAQWSLQFIKLRYTQDHFRKLLGSKGEVAFVRLNRDMIEDGMEVMIKASGTDKLKAQNNAMNMAKMGLTDPLTFFEDMGVSDPEGRAEKLMTFKTDPVTYMTKYVMNMGDTNAMVAGLSGQGNTPGQPPVGGGALPEAGGAPPTAPAPAVSPVPMQPTLPTAGNTAAVPATPSVGAPTGSPRIL